MLNELFELCEKTELDLVKIEECIVKNNFSTYDITYFANVLVDKYIYEYEDREAELERPPKPNELVSSTWLELFPLLLRYGLNSNEIVSRDDSKLNIMNNILFIKNGDVAPKILRLLLENKGNPNLEYNGETIFEELDFDIWFGIVEQDNKEYLNLEIKCWLLLIAYGGQIKDIEPITMKNGYTKEAFKNFEDFSFEAKVENDERIVRVFNKQSLELVAECIY